MDISTEHLRLDERGKVRLIGSSIKVMHIAMRVRDGLSANQIHDSYPHLSLAQIYAALAYYYDHKDEIDNEMRLNDEAWERGANSPEQAEFVKRLKAKLPDGHPLKSR